MACCHSEEYRLIAADPVEFLPSFAEDDNDVVDDDFFVFEDDEVEEEEDKEEDDDDDEGSINLARSRLWKNCVVKVPS